MSEFYIVSDATADLPQDIVEDLGIRIIPMNFTFNGTEYTHYPDEREMTLDSFYEGLDAGAEVSTSQITPAMYWDFIEPLVAEGRDILYICFTSGLSGTYNASAIAFEGIGDKYPERKLVTIDSRCASIGEGFLVYLAALRKKAGAGLEELVEYVEKMKTEICHWFMVKDLNQLKKGGRISPLAAALGTTLGIVPIISTDREGKLKVITKVHGLKKALAYLADRFRNDSFDPTDEGSRRIALIGHGHCPEYAENLRNLIVDTGLADETRILQIGPVIGSHVGSGMCAVVFVGENYKESD